MRLLLGSGQSCMHGARSPLRRCLSAACARAQESRGTDVLIVSLKAAALGLNLCAANHVILLDLWWNPAVEEQAIDRAHRIGQKRTVHVTRITIAGAGVPLSLSLELQVILPEHSAATSACAVRAWSLQRLAARHHAHARHGAAACTWHAHVHHCTSCRCMHAHACMRW